MIPGSGNSIATCIHGNYAPCQICMEIRAKEEYPDEDEKEEYPNVFPPCNLAKFFGEGQDA